MSSLLMKAMDKDSSGTTSLDEFKSVGQSLPSGTIDQSDEALSSAFSSLDSDQNGSLTESEIATGLAKFSQQSATAMLGQQEVGGPPPPPPPPGGGKDGGDGFFTEADSDESGTVSLAEFTAAGPKSVSSDQAESLFASIDTDSDGEISKTEDETFRSSQQAAPSGPPPGPPPSGGAESSSTSTDDDEDDTTPTLAAQLSELLSARSAYSGSSVSSYLDAAASSLFSASA